MITEKSSAMPLSRLRDMALVAAGVSVTALAIVAIILILVLYPRVSRATTNLEQASASAVVVAGNLETVTNDMVAVAGAIRASADRVALAADRIGDAAGKVGETVGNLRERAAEFDVQLSGLSGQMELFREQADRVDALLSQFGR